jgi:Tfp pilus assembly protein FimT
MRIKNNHKGFSIVELVVYVSLASIMLLAIASFSKIILEARTRNRVISEVEQQGTQVAQTISQSIRNSEGIISPTAGGSSDNLNLNVVNTSQDPTVFSLDSGVINIQEGSGNQVNLTNGHVVVQDLVFQNLSRPNTPGVVKFSFILEYNNQSNKPEYNYSKTFYSSASLR